MQRRFSSSERPGVQVFRHCLPARDARVEIEEVLLQIPVLASQSSSLRRCIGAAAFLLDMLQHLLSLRPKLTGLSRLMGQVLKGSEVATKAAISVEAFAPSQTLLPTDTCDAGLRQGLLDILFEEHGNLAKRALLCCKAVGLLGQPRGRLPQLLIGSCAEFFCTPTLHLQACSVTFQAGP